MANQLQLFAVVLAGGSGTRFWPASRRLRPKQLLALGPESDESLIASTVKRLSGLVEPSRILISTGAHLVDATRQQLPQLPEHAFLAEPQAKNTAPCIGWATSVVAQMDPDAIVCVIPSDQHIARPDAFRAALSQAAEEASQGRIVTIGIVPTRPDTGYGYVQRGSCRSEDVFAVRRFVEKPDRATAESYLASGEYYWNAGIFVFRARDMLSAFERHLPQMAEQLRELSSSRASESEKDSAEAEFFQNCESISIDYGVMEKETSLSVVAGDFGWSDLGSWESAWELSEKDEAGNAAPPTAVLVDATDNLVADLSLGTKKKVIALVGVEGLCVVETDDALLVLPRERCQEVRRVVAQLKEEGPADAL